MAHTFIASDRVEGSDVCQSDGRRIGTIQRLMIDKRSGQIAYAVVKSGGVLGFGEKHFPMPWAALKYEFATGTYKTDLSAAGLRDVLSKIGGKFDWGDRSDEIVVRTRSRLPMYGI
jgi:sporulation protein YlmC with PRC-barrel domain